MLFKKLPYWLKSGLICGIFMTALINILPQYSIFENAPGFLSWFNMTIAAIFMALCILFSVDFVSNYAPNEGPLRKILLPLFSSFSIFIVSFIVGSMLALIIKYLIGKIARKK